MPWKKHPEKRARVEGDGVKGRTGVMWRNPNYVVEMRLPKKVANLKLHFGSYERVEEAMVARDYAAYLRNSTGKEDRATVGGFGNPDVDHSIFKFEESLEVFENLEGSGSRAQARCDEYRSLLELQTPQACTNFHVAAREDIRVAIESFRSRDPQKFPRPPLLNHLPDAEPVDGETHRTPPPSSSEVRVSPTPGRGGGASMGEGSTSFIGVTSLGLQITLNDSPSQTLLHMNVLGLTSEEIYMITKAGIDWIQRELNQLIDKWLEGVEPCLIDPETIPALE